MQLTSPRHQPPLDIDFVPAALWHRTYHRLVENDPRSSDLHLALTRKDGTTFRHHLRILPHEGGNRALNNRYVERSIKFLFWMKGGSRLLVAGEESIVSLLATIYSEGGARSFDREIVGQGIFGEPITVVACPQEELPPSSEENVTLGRNLNGCRIGFDLGGSDRKAAALIDGKVVFSEEIPWDPYFQSDPDYHLNGIRDTLQRAAAHLPKVDAIGGSAAGDYINNEVRIASLFRGITDQGIFERDVRTILLKLKKEW